MIHEINRKEPSKSAYEIQLGFIQTINTIDAYLMTPFMQIVDNKFTANRKYSSVLKYRNSNA